jgi:glycosyltransferase involved in cell wall biosynthesis
VTVRLGIDATAVSPTGKGIARVQRGTVAALAELDRYELVVFARHPEELPEVAAVPVRDFRTLWWEQRGLEREIRGHRLDVMLTWTERLPVRGRGRYLVWLFEPPDHRIARNREVGTSLHQRASDAVTLLVWKRSLRRAAVCLTGSDATAEVVREQVPAAIVQTLYPGIEPEFSPGPGDGDRYVLAILTSDPRDDPETALAAFERVRASDPAVRLRVAGGYRGAAPEGVELLGRVDDDELIRLYRGAAAYLDTSLYEGFGVQVLEAMACGAPVVATNVTSIPEIVADAAVLRPAGRADELGDALVQVLSDGELAADLRRRGIERAAQFTWERTAAQLAEAVDRALA